MTGVCMTAACLTGAGTATMVVCGHRGRLVHLVDQTRVDIGMPVAHLDREPLGAGNLAQHFQRLPRLDPADDREIGARPGPQIGGLADLPASRHRLEVGGIGGGDRGRLRRLGHLLSEGKSLTGAQGDQESGGKDGATHGNGTFEWLTGKLACCSSPTYRQGIAEPLTTRIPQKGRQSRQNPRTHRRSARPAQRQDRPWKRRRDPARDIRRQRRPCRARDGSG